MEFDILWEHSLFLCCFSNLRNNIQESPGDGNAVPGGRDCQKRALPFFDKRIAVCRAHALPAYGGQGAHLQPELYFLSGTRPDRK